ncbi:MAG: GGDEF domain-containing protein [Candidatus Aminicenantes bacterium]|nr:GGDEF domain-containing protein [Candidatus Aminicenantes bacterium]
MKEKKENLNEVVDAKIMAIKLIIEKNSWLTKIRWLYTVFVLLFFYAYNYFSHISYINYRALILILALAVLGNLMFIFTLKRNTRLPEKEQDYDTYSTIASIQLDFDLVILSLLIFYSGGFESPITVLFIFYIMVATFLIYHKKAFKNTLIAVVLVVVIFFANKGLVITSQKLTEMIGFTLILFFAFFISAYFSKYLRKNEKSLHEFIELTGTLSVTDRLTNLYNQTHFFLLFNLQLEKAKRYDSIFSILLFDVDHFKNYNDTSGHMQGSEALKRVGELMKKMFRVSDILGRFGGDEFIVLLSRSDKVGTYLAADRLREIVEKEPFIARENQPSGKITLSMGIASYPEHGKTLEELLDKADQALYVAKKTGRNRVIIYDPKNDKSGKNTQKKHPANN